MELSIGRPAGDWDNGLVQVMKANAGLAGLILAALSVLSVAPVAGESLVSYVHVATAANISGSHDEYTKLDHPQLNDNPDARLLVTQNWNPPLGSGVYNDHEVGVVFIANYSGGGSWYIYNEDATAIPVGAAFNVLVMGGDSLSFVHLSNDINTSGRATRLNPIDPDCLLCPSSTLMLYTHTATFEGIPGGSFNHHSSIVYGSPSYSIVTENADSCCLDLMPTGVFFNVLIAKSPDIASSLGWSFEHFASAGTNSGNSTFLDHPELNGRAGAVVFVARAGPVLVSSAHVLGVWFTGSVWAIFFQDHATMIENSLYNLYIPPLMSDGFESGDTSWWSATVVAP